MSDLKVRLPKDYFSDPSLPQDKLKPNSRAIFTWGL